MEKMNKQLVQRFQQARKDKDLVVLEGFHAFKHAVRFKAKILIAVSLNKQKFMKLVELLASDCRKELIKLGYETDESWIDTI